MADREKSRSPSHIIPSRIVQTALQLRGEAGPPWLERLPGIIESCVQQWSLVLNPPFSQLSYNWAAPGMLQNGAPIVLQVCFPDKEFFTEAEALRIYDGRGSVRLLAVDLEGGALLLERLLPGAALESMVDDQQATHIAARVMQTLWRPAPQESAFPSFATWIKNMARLAPSLVEPHSAFPARWIERALSLFVDLSDPHVELVLLHGDLHQGNILSAGREPWLAIDPKGVTGEPVCETGPLLINVLPSFSDTRETRRVLLRRMAQLAEELGFRFTPTASVGCGEGCAGQLLDSGRTRAGLVLVPAGRRDPLECEREIKL
jgi:streptomycin 6-kinase